MEESSTDLSLISTHLHILIFCLSGAGWGLSMGIQVWVGELLLSLNSEWSLDYSSSLLVPIALMTGVFFGSYVWGIISDRYGRRIPYSQALIFMSLGSVLASFSQSILFISACYLVIGFGIGGSFAVDGTVFLEYSSEKTAFLLVALSIFSPIGSAFPSALFWIFSSYFFVFNPWRFVQFSIGLFAAFVAIPRFWVKETPMFRISKALESPENNENCESNLNSEKRKIFHNKGNESVFQQFSKIFEKPLQKYTVLYIIIWSTLCFTYSGVNALIPEVLRRAGITDSEKINKIIFFQQISKNYLVGIPAVILATFLVKGPLGRKWTFCLSMIFCAFLLYGYLLTLHEIV